MLLNVVNLVPQKAWFRHILLISFPRAARGFDVIRQAGRVDETIPAIGSDAKGVAANHGNVVRQTRMSDRVELRKQCIIVCQFIEDGHQRVADHRPELFVLKNEHDDMIKVWNERYWG